MSASIIKVEDRNNCHRMFYAEENSAPAELGFALFDLFEDGSADISRLSEAKMEKYKISEVNDIPKDIQYEYIITGDSKVPVHCQECWYTSDKSYHGGGFRHGGTYDLKEWKIKVELQQKYSYRRPEAWK